MDGGGICGVVFEVLVLMIVVCLVMMLIVWVWMLVVFEVLV